jgi:hypothetical protein
MQQRALSSRPGRFPWWVYVIVLLGAALLAGGAIISQADPKMLLSSGEQMTGAVKVYADYTFSRDVVLALGLLVLLALHARRMLAGLMLLTIGIQLVDAVEDIIHGRATLLAPLIVYAIAYYTCVRWLLGGEPWNAAVWTDRSPRQAD